MNACVFPEANKIVAVGDLHGNYEGFVRILSHAELIDENENWIAQETHLVQTGDVVGRGGDPGKIFRLLRKLQEQAPGSGSQVHVLLGNHELMTIHGLNSYNTPEEYRGFSEDWTAVASQSEGAADESARANPENIVKELAENWKKFNAMMSPSGPVGRWLCRQQVAIQLGPYLFVHAGLTAEYGCMPLAELNALMLAESMRDLSDWSVRKGSLLFRDDAPMWNRDYTLRPNEAAQLQLDQVLKFHACEAMVVGHTPTFMIDRSKMGKVVGLFGGKLQCIDTGIGKAYGRRLGALAIYNGQIMPFYP